MATFYDTVRNRLIGVRVNGPQPGATQIASAITLASRAPSVHNTQPWCWRVTSRSLELFADPTRRLQASDRNARLLMLSCGATLHHLAVAVAVGAEGWHAEIHRFPDATLPTKLASIDFTAQPSTREVRELARAIADRRSDRRPMSSWPVPTDHVDHLAALAAEYGAIARTLDPSELSVWNALARRAARRRALPEYRAELYKWTHRDESRRDGIPAVNRVPIDESEATRVNRFAPGDLPLAPRAADDPQALSLLIATSSDDPLARLRAGEAMSAVLLEATRIGLATAIDSQVLEMDSTRSVVEDRLLHGSLTPQVLLTVGWPSSADPLPATPRRSLGDVLNDTTGAAVGVGQAPPSI
jgi:nitroreductase